MKLNPVIATTMMLVIYGVGWASSVETPPEAAWKSVLTISTGPAWSDPGKTQTVLLLPSLPQLYVASSNTQTISASEINFSLQHRVTQHLLGQVGLAVAAATKIPLNGEIWQDSDPEFNNFNYAYKINHSHVAVRGKLLTDFYQLMQPYVGASLGVGFNRAFSYSDTPTLVEVSAEPPFQPNTNTTFIYTLDVGIQKSVGDHWIIGIGYEFADWGKSQLAAASGQTVGSGLLINDIYVNELLFSLSFIA